jgi:hypothetical protein
MIAHRTADLFEYALGEEKPDAIAHVVNNVGEWGAGFVLPLASEFPEAKIHYEHEWQAYSLGDVQRIKTSRGVDIYNLFAQDGIEGVRPLRYGWLAKSLRQVGEMMDKRTHIYMPRIGCGLAGGSWDVVEPLIEEGLSDQHVTVFTLPREQHKFD